MSSKLTGQKMMVTAIKDDVNDDVNGARFGSYLTRPPIGINNKNEKNKNENFLSLCTDVILWRSDSISQPGRGGSPFGCSKCSANRLTHLH